jgi:ribonuclease HI
LADIGPIRTHSPTSGLEIFTNTIPLDLFIRGEFIAAHNRIKNVITTIAGTCDTINSHYAWARKLRDEAGLNNIPSDTIAPYFHGNKKYTCSSTQYNTLNETRPYKLQIFTDGSRIKNSLANNHDGHAGCGFVIYGQNHEGTHCMKYEKSSYLGTMSTVFQAEIFAIGQAAHHLILNRDMIANITDIDIISDSKSAIQALDSICTPSKIIMDCMKALDSLQELVKVTIHWTKAHVGHEGNERADTLAKEGTAKISYQVEPILPVPKSWIRRKTQQYLQEEWTRRWTSSSEAGRQKSSSHNLTLNSPKNS